MAGFESLGFDAGGFDVGGGVAVVGAPVSPAITVPTVRSTKLGGYYDLVLDPITRDYIDTANGEWLESADSRTMVFAILEMRLGGSSTDPDDGTRIAELLETGEPVTPENVVDEATRALQILINDGAISDLSVSPSFDETGRFALVLYWTDRAGGLPVDLVYTL